MGSESGQHPLDGTGRSPSRRRESTASAAFVVQASPQLGPEVLSAALRRFSRGDLDVLPPGERGLIRARHGVTELRAIGTQMHEGLRQAFRGVDFWVGISRMRLHPRDIEEAVAEAEQAVALSRMLESDPRAVLFDDALLAAALGANTILRDQLASILDPVAEGDPKMGGALLSSIGAFFRSDMSIRGAAHLLGVHRHTLEYRLRRAENLLGRSIRRGPDRLLIEVALMAAGMRSGPKSGRPQSSPR